MACASLFTVPTDLANGNHTFVVTGTDAAGNTGRSTLSFAFVPVLVSIQVTPSNSNLPVGYNRQFTATGTFSDGTNQDLTNSVAWSSSNPVTATISNATGSQGLATAAAPGTTQITARLDAIVGSTTLTVTSPVPTGGNGSFVIGDLDAVVGRKIYFWGAQWAKNNHLSQSVAPSSFKGFANSIGGPNPHCGGVWASNPGGNSEPNSVPSLITVIASSSVTKSGSVISGNNRKIVVIRPDPGYSSSVGREGTGTVVSVTCD